MDANNLLSAGLVEAIGQRLEAAHDRNLSVRHDALADFINQFLESHEQDLASLVKPCVDSLCEHPDVPEQAKQLFRILAQPEHQTQFFTAIFSIQGIITQFVGAAVAPFVQDVSNVAWQHSPVMPLSPAELALADIRNQLEGINPYVEAQKSGLDPKRYEVMKLNTGEALGIQALLEAYRRGIIDDAGLLKGIRQSRVRDEWYDTIKKLRYAPPSPQEVVAGAVEGHLPIPEAQGLFEDAGMDPKHWGWFYETAGRPPGTMELIELWRRDEIDEATLIAAIRESNIKNKYIPNILAFKRHVLPQRSVVSMLRHGVITDARARELFKYEGIVAEDADALVKEAHQQKAATQHDLSVGVIKTLYADGALPRTEASQKITALGYDNAEASLILDTVDMVRLHRFRQSAIGHTHSRYIAWHIDKSTVVTDLDKMGIDPKERDALIELWDLERQSDVRTLTVTQLQSAHKHKLIDDIEFIQRTERMGYSPEDARMLLALTKPIPKATPTTSVTSAPA